eukprot:8127123-Pyramimonas_sp.AAC.1
MFGAPQNSHCLCAPSRRFGTQAESAHERAQSRVIKGGPNGATAGGKGWQRGRTAADDEDVHVLGGGLEPAVQLGAHGSGLAGLAHRHRHVVP